MAVRKIEYAVSVSGISPAVKQFAGSQSEHKATEVEFNLDESLYRSLTEQSANGGKLIYRFDGYDGIGGVCSSDTSVLESSKVNYLLEEWLTRYGGVAKVILVISLLKDDLTEMELFTFPALLQLKNLPEGTETDGESYESMSVLAQVAKDSANTAVESAEAAVDARERTELARAALENGTEWVFDGGNSRNPLNVEFVVDSEMSDGSQNAVMNKVIKKYVDNLISNTVESLTKQAKLDAHPIGSYYWSSQPNSPGGLFGGTWERVEGKFILAAGTYTDKNGEERSFEVGETDNGEYRHTLKEEEMPSHSHDMFLTSSQAAHTLDNISASRRTIDLNYWGTCNTTYWHKANINDTGSNQPHNNMPPYEVAYCWKRIA